MLSCEPTSLRDVGHPIGGGLRGWGEFDSPANPHLSRDVGHPICERLGRWGEFDSPANPHLYEMWGTRFVEGREGGVSSIILRTDISTRCGAPRFCGGLRKWGDRKTSCARAGIRCGDSSPAAQNDMQRQYGDSGSRSARSRMTEKCKYSGPSRCALRMTALGGARRTTWFRRGQAARA